MFAGDDAESPFMKDALKALRRGVTSQLQVSEVRCPRTVPPLSLRPVPSCLRACLAEVCGRHQGGAAQSSNSPRETHRGVSLSKETTRQARILCKFAESDHNGWLSCSTKSTKSKREPRAATGGRPGAGGEAGAAGVMATTRSRSIWRRTKNAARWWRGRAGRRGLCSSWRITRVCLRVCARCLLPSGRQARSAVS